MGFIEPFSRDSFRNYSREPRRKSLQDLLLGVFFFLHEHLFLELLQICSKYLLLFFFWKFFSALGIFSTNTYFSYFARNSLKYCFRSISRSSSRASFRAPSFLQESIGKSVERFIQKSISAWIVLENFQGFLQKIQKFLPRTSKAISFEVPWEISWRNLEEFLQHFYVIE